MLPATRPDTLRLLQRTGAETLKLLAGLGKGLTDRIEPLYIGDAPATIVALQHFRYAADGLGIGLERIADPSLSEGAIYRLRDVHLLRPEAAMPAIAAWLDAMGVVRFDTPATGAIVGRDGAASLSATATAAHTILADDAAILAHVAETQRDKLLVPHQQAAILTAPNRRPTMPLICYPDRGLLLQQRGTAGVMALVNGDMATAHLRLGAALDPPEPLPRAGEKRFTAITTADGGPLLTTLRASPAQLTAGFGPTAAFLAPAVARAIAGVSPIEEATWFAARAGARTSRAAAEYEAVPA